MNNYPFNHYYQSDNNNLSSQPFSTRIIHQELKKGGLEIDFRLFIPFDAFSSLSKTSNIKQKVASPTSARYCCYIVSHKKTFPGRKKYLTYSEYEKFFQDAEENHFYDMFIDGTRPNYPCYKKTLNDKVEENTLTAMEFALIREYIETGKAMFPGETQAVKQYNQAQETVRSKRQIGDESARDYFRKARRKIDVELSKGKYRAFKSGKEIDTSIPSDVYQFNPPPEVKYALVCPYKPTISAEFITK